MPEFSAEELKELKAAFIAEPWKGGLEPPVATQEPSGGGLRLLVKETIQKWTGKELSGLKVTMKELGDNLERSFVALSKKTLKVRFQTMEVTNLEEGAFCLPEGFYSIVFSLDPLIGKAAIVIDPWLVFFMVYTVLAGDPPERIERPINPLEGELFYHALVGKLEESLLSGFKGLVPLNLKPEGFRTRPQALYICDPKESVALARFKVMIGDTEEEKEADLLFLLPLRPFEGIRETLSVPYRGDYNENVKGILKKELTHIPLHIKAELDSITITLGGLLKLAKGCVLPLGRSADDYRATLVVEGVKKFKGSLGQKGGMRAVCIQDGFSD